MNTTMITVKVTNCIFRLKNDWKRLIDEETGKIYLTYSFHRLIWIIYSIRKIINRKLYKDFRIKYYYVKDIKKGVVLILPLCVNLQTKEIHFIGNLFSVGYNDAIYKTSNIEYIDYIFMYIKRYYEGYKFLFDDLLYDSIISRSGCLKKNTQSYTTRECFAINISGDRETWFSGLTKSTRQNLRTAYNRMKTDNVTYKLEQYEKAPNYIKMQLYILYKKRLNEIIDKEEIIKDDRFIDKLKIYFHCNTNVFFLGSSILKRGKIVVMYMNDKPSAFWIHFSENDGIIVPRLSIDTSFGRYSPGGILISEYLNKNINNINTSNFRLDLSRGNEPYKKVYGGKLYYNYMLHLYLENTIGEYSNT